MDGSYTVSSEYKLLVELKVNTNFMPLWDAQNANGHSVGVMNVPTTNIAPKVNSFFVSGGGAKLRNLSLEYLNRLQKMNNFFYLTFHHDK